MFRRLAPEFEFDGFAPREMVVYNTQDYKASGRARALKRRLIYTANGN